MKLPSKGAMLRRAMRSGCVALPGAFNAATARLVEHAGFSGVYVSGAGLSNATAGVPDIGLLSREEVVTLAGYVAAAVSVPAIVDADTGFGGVRDVPATVRAFERAGIAGMHIEDQVFPKRCGHLSGKEIVPAKEMIAKIRAAVKARRDRDFLIIARTDSRAVEGFEAAVARAKAYLQAGADAIFPEALETPAEFRQYARQVDAPLLANMTEFGKGPLLSVKQLAGMGYRLVIFPQTAFRVAMRAEESALSELRRAGTQKSLLDRMQTRQELYQLLDYDPMAEAWPPKPAKKMGASRKARGV